MSAAQAQAPVAVSPDLGPGAALSAEGPLAVPPDLDPAAAALSAQDPLAVATDLAPAVGLVAAFLAPHLVVAVAFPAVGMADAEVTAFGPHLVLLPLSVEVAAWAQIPCEEYGALAAHAQEVEIRGAALLGASAFFVKAHFAGMDSAPRLPT